MEMKDPSRIIVTPRVVILAAEISSVVYLSPRGSRRVCEFLHSCLQIQRFSSLVTK